MKRPEDPKVAIEGIIKIIILVDIIYFICLFIFVENFKFFSIVILITNLAFLFLRESYKKDIKKVEAWLEVNPKK